MPVVGLRTRDKEARSLERLPVAMVFWESDRHRVGVTTRGVTKGVIDQRTQRRRLIGTEEVDDLNLAATSSRDHETE